MTVGVVGKIDPGRLEFPPVNVYEGFPKTSSDQNPYSVEP